VIFPFSFISSLDLRTFCQSPSLSPWPIARRQLLLRPSQASASRRPVVPLYARREFTAITLRRPSQNRTSFAFFSLHLIMLAYVFERHRVREEFDSDTTENRAVGI